MTSDTLNFEQIRFIETKLVAPKYITSWDMVDHDWSGCRSPARAKRRAKRGYKQHVVCTPRKDFLMHGNTIICHPETLKNLKALIQQETKNFERRWENMFLNSIPNLIMSPNLKS